MSMASQPPRRPRWVFTGYLCAANQLTFNSQRDKLIASVRRNSYLAYLQAEDKTERLKKSASEALGGLADSVLNTWSESELKNFCDKNGIKGMRLLFGYPSSTILYLPES